MAITIDWPSRVISIPRADMPLVQLTPVEVRQLDLNIFRLALKDLEDGEDGIVWLDTHVHVPPASVSGIELARQVILANGYTVTFEDGQYAVNLFGANTNLQDLVNVNQVSVRANNSAGLVQTREIQFGAFNGAVWVDAVNGTTSTTYPAGTPLLPVSTIPAATFIAGTRGLSTLKILTDITLGTGDDVTNYRLIGNNILRTTITILPGAQTLGVEIQEASVTGTLDGGTQLSKCFVFDLSYINGFIVDCELSGTIRLGGTQDAQFIGCYASTVVPTLDFNNTLQPCNVQGWLGDIGIANRTTTAAAEVFLAAGIVTLLPSVTTGVNLHIGGVGLLENLSATVPQTLALVSPQSVWALANGVESGVTPQQSMRIMLAALAGKLSGSPSGPIVIRNVGDTKNRITATVDSNGNRTAVATDGS